MATAGIGILSWAAAIAVSSSTPAGAAGVESADLHAGHLGNVHFTTSCASEVQASFDASMVFLHAFWAKDAIGGFKEVLQRDPECAIAYWGIAMAYQQNPLTAQQPSSEAAREALAGLAKAKTIGAKTQRERDYISAIELIYRDVEKVDFPMRRRAYENAMEALAQRYPDDAEAAIFYALSLDMTASLTDKTYANQLKAAAILEKALAHQPQHPGIAHYLIHSYDYPPIADRGLPAARLYARLAPDHPHALHMPSHIFTRLGMWRDSIDSNMRSAAAAKAEGNGQEQAHAMDYLVYAHLQLGEDAQSRRVVAESASLAVNRGVFIGPYALAAMPARYALERGAWSEAAALTVVDSEFLFPDAITRFARGLGFVHMKDLASAEKEAQALTGLRDTLRSRNTTYWANQVDVQRLAVEASIAFARGDREGALATMRVAADLEDSMEKHIVTPGAVVPTRELLGDMLLEAKRPRDALAAYEASAQREPERLHGVYGAARAAEQMGDDKVARSYYARLVKMTASGNASRPELLQAKSRLAAIAN